jgi:serine protease Do
MRKTIFTILLMMTGFAFAQETPATPEVPAAPAAPSAKPAKPAKPPKPPRTPATVISRGSYLGIDSRDVTSDRVAPLKLKEERGVEVVMVDQDAPAGKAGLKEHDVILSFNGNAIQDVGELRRVIRETPPGKTVVLGISRDGQWMNVNAQLADRQKVVASHGMIAIPRIEIPPMPDIEVPSFAMLQYSRRNGLMVENLTRQLGDFFGAKEGRGVLVRGVEKNSPAEVAGFRAGDVIVRVANEPVQDMGDWNQLMRQQQSGKVTVTVIREKREQNLTLSVPERRRSEGSQVVIPGFDDGDMDVQVVELADLGPQIQKQLEHAQIAIKETINSKKFQKQMENLQVELKKNMEIDQKEIQKQVEHAKKQCEKALHEAEREHRRVQQEMDDEE